MARCFDCLLVCTWTLQCTVFVSHDAVERLFNFFGKLIGDLLLRYIFVVLVCLFRLLQRCCEGVCRTRDLVHVNRPFFFSLFNISSPHPSFRLLFLPFMYTPYTHATCPKYFIILLYSIISGLFFIIIVAAALISLLLHLRI